MKIKIKAESEASSGGNRSEQQQPVQVNEADVIQIQSNFRTQLHHDRLAKVSKQTKVLRR